MKTFQDYKTALLFTKLITHRHKRQLIASKNTSESNNEGMITKNYIV